MTEHFDDSENEKERTSDCGGCHGGCNASPAKQDLVYILFGKKKVLTIPLTEVITDHNIKFVPRKFIGGQPEYCFSSQEQGLFYKSKEEFKQFLSTELSGRFQIPVEEKAQEGNAPVYSLETVIVTVRVEDCAIQPAGSKQTPEVVALLSSTSKKKK